MIETADDLKLLVRAPVEEQNKRCRFRNRNYWRGTNKNGFLLKLDHGLGISIILKGPGAIRYEVGDIWYSYDATLQVPALRVVFSIFHNIASCSIFHFLREVYVHVFLPISHLIFSHLYYGLIVPIGSGQTRPPGDGVRLPIVFLWMLLSLMLLHSNISFILNRTVRALAFTSSGTRTALVI